MEVISIVSAKGGVSKSLLSINLFDYLRNELKKKVLLIDTDTQKTSFEFLSEKNIAEDIEAVNVEKDLDKLLSSNNLKSYDYVIIDTAPTINQLNAHIIKHSDKILIATKPALFDIKSVYNTIDLVKENKHCKSCVLFTQTINNSINTKNTISELKEMLKESENITVLDSVLSHSATYVNTINNLMFVSESKNKKQKQELESIFNSLITL